MTIGGDDGQARWQRICAVLDAVFDAPDGERERVLAEHCAGDASLRAEVESMLAAEDTTDHRLDMPAADWAGDVLDEVEADVEAARSHSPGEMIGDYRLVRELGRGGMGTVWLAERSGAEFSQQVALKLLKRGLDTDAVLGRFYEERRILARLRHPHIALFLDGGVADTGQPWFTMEWVDGAPITEWCDARRLGVRERVALFLDAVAAVQYAHQQLIVHRDLKPGNVLVSESGEVKLLDFGIAKMLDTTQGSAQVATMTRMGVRMLTPAYASPEQLRGDPATTATDVYALGVLLGELLGGKRPGPKAREAATVSVQRPSNQVEEATAALRGTSPERLRRQLRGDLDTIVLKAVSGEASRRYGSAQAFGEDLRRWLDGQPVQARPDSAWYSARRFIGRHRLGTAAAAVMVLSLATGALVATWQAREANRQAQRAEQARNFLVRIFLQANPDKWRDAREPGMGEVLDAGARLVDEELAKTPELHAEMLFTLGAIYEARGKFDRAEALLRRSLEERRRLFGEAHEAYADSLLKLSSVRYEKGDWKGGQRMATQAAAIFERRLGDHPSTAEAYEGVASALSMGSDPEQAVRLQFKALEIYRHSKGERSEEVARVEESLGLNLVDRGRHAEGEALLKQAMETRRQLTGPRSLPYAKALNSYALGLGTMGQSARAAEIYGQIVAIYSEFRDVGQMEIALGNLGDAQQGLGLFDEAERNLRKTLELAGKGPRAGTRWEAHRMLSLADLLAARGRSDEAEPLMRRAVAGMERDAGPDHVFLPESLNRLAEILIERGRIAEASALATRADGMLRRQFGANNYRAAFNRGLMGRLQFATGERERGLKTVQSALRTLQAIQGEKLASVSSVAKGLATLQLQSGQWPQAEAGFRALERALEKVGRKPWAIEAGMLRGAALMQMGRECEPALREAMSQRQAMYGQNNARTGEARLYLGVCLHRRGRAGEARELIDRGRAEFTGQFGENHFVVRLADVELDRKR